MSALTDRASALREFFRLVNADSSDDDMTEHDASTLEGAYEALDVGLKRAQLYLIGIGQGEIWLTTGATLTVTGSDPSRYSQLPADFFRLDSDPEQHRSGLVYPTGLPWGREILPAQRRHVTGNYYWVEWDATNQYARVRYARGAAVPSNLVPEYYRKATTLADSTAMDVRPDDRNLVPAFAADYAMNQSWFAGGMEQKQAIDRNLKGVRSESFARSRLTRRRRQVETAPSRGQWIT